jgi:hypothetical protein
MQRARWNGVVFALGSAALACAVPASGAPHWVDPGIVVGVGVVGTNQYDNGQAKCTFAASLTTGLWRPHERWSLLGLGMGLRASNGLEDFDEIGVVVPIVTFHKGAWITQAGWMVQRLNGEKHLWYLGTGIGFSRKRTAPRPTGPRAEGPPVTGAGLAVPWAGPPRAAETGRTARRGRAGWRPRARQLPE